MNQKLKSILVFTITVISATAIVVAVVKAGSLTPPLSSTPQSTMYTLEDIYNKIVNGTDANEADHTFGPPAPPTTGTMFTLTQIYDKLPDNDQICSGTNSGTAVCGGSELESQHRARRRVSASVLG
mgnify:CR=1 FL=1